ncbi:myoneurin [Galendromus occidentalis]|uniref:Myoneurin n=1 Tax=Galendromus occidentalis TaxID=34638 RepID=A0AAJ6QV16_9ACAR|nr:myoneurin [Galendromus occidentalis]
MAEQGDGSVKLVVIKASPTGQIPVKNVQVQDVHVVINSPASDKPYPCPCCCTARFALKSSLRRHVKTHHGDHPNRHDALRKAFECRICHQEFKTNSDLWHHRTTDHNQSGDDVSQENSQENRGIVCGLCSFSYRKVQDLKRHMVSQHPQHNGLENPESGTEQAEGESVAADPNTSSQISVESKPPEQPIRLVVITPNNVHGERVTRVPKTVQLAFKCSKGNNNTRKVVEELLNIDSSEDQLLAGQ